MYSPQRVLLKGRQEGRSENFLLDSNLEGAYYNFEEDLQRANMWSQNPGKLITIVNMF